MGGTYTLKLKKYREIEEKARKKICELVIRDTKPYTPYREKGFGRATRVENEYRRIVYGTPYARYLWHGKLMLAANGSSWAKRGEKKHLTDIDLKYTKSVHPKAGPYWVLKAKDKNIKTWEMEIEKELKSRVLVRV